MRLIDADALEKDLFPEGTSGGFWGFGQLCEILDRQPTIDVMEVVRSDDCEIRKLVEWYDKQRGGFSLSSSI